MPRNRPEHINTFTGGMNKEAANSMVAASQYRHAENLRITTTDGEGNGVLVNIDGTESSFTISLGIGAVPKVVGHTTLRNDIILFTMSSVTSVERSQIWRISHDELTGVTTGNTSPLYESQHLGFSVDHPIEAIARYENEDVQRVYWTDNVNPVRSINLAADDLSTLDSDILELSSNADLRRITFGGSIAGSLPVGMYQYSYRLGSNSGALSKFAVLSDLMPVVQNFENTSNFLYSNANGGVTGDNIGENSGKSLVLRLNNLDDRYDYIEVACAYYAQRGVDPVVTIIERQNIPDDQELEVIHSGTEAAIDISKEELLSLSSNLKTAKTIAVKDNRLFAGNITTTPVSDLEMDAVAKRYKTNGTTYTDDDNVNPYNMDIDADIDANSYAYQSNGTTLGGTGTNVSYEFITHDVGYGDTAIGPQGVTSSPAEFLCDTAVQTVNPLTQSGLQDESTDNSWKNFKSPFYLSHLKGYTRGEIYRFGIVLYDLKGNPGFVNWIGDIKFPTGLNNTDSAFALGSTSPTAASSLTSLGIKFRVTIPTDIQDKVSGYRIVRMERTAGDRSIVATGAVFNTYTYEVFSTTNPYTSNVSNLIIGETFDADSNSLVSENGNRFIANGMYPANWGDLSDVIHHEVDKSSGATATGETIRVGKVQKNNNLITLESPDFHFLGDTSNKANDHLRVVGIAKGDPSVTLKEDALISSSSWGKTAGGTTHTHEVEQKRPYPSVFAVKELTDPYMDVYENSNADYTYLADIVGDKTARSTAPLEHSWVEYFALYNIDHLHSSGETLADRRRPIYSSKSIAAGEDAAIALGSGSARQEYEYKNAFVGFSFTLDKVNDIDVGAADGKYGDNAAKTIKYNYSGIGSKTLLINAQYINTSSGPYAITHQPLYLNFFTYADGSWASGGAKARKISASYQLTNTLTDATMPSGDRPIVQYVRDIVADQYGGVSNEARQGQEYIPCSAIVNTTDLASTVEVFGGDTIVGYYNTTKANHRPDGKGFRVGYTFPVESTVAFDLRAGNNFTNVNSTSDLASTPDDFILDSVYLFAMDAGIEKYYTRPSVVEEINDFDNRVVASSAKTNGELVDSWREFDTVSYLDVDGINGPINKLASFRDQIYFLQDSGFGRIAISPRAVVSTEAVGALELGEGRVLHDFQYFTTEFGSFQQFSVIVSDFGLYFIDSLRKKIFQFTEGLNPISDSSINSFLHESDTLNALTKDNPYQGEGINAVVDKKYNEVLFTFFKNDNQTVAFSEQMKNFSSFYSFTPVVYLQVNNSLFSIKNVGSGTIYKHDVGEKGKFYGTYYDSKLDFLVNVGPGYTKTFDNVAYQLESYSNNQTDGVIDEIRFHTDYQNTDWITTDLTNTRRVEREWKLAIPRNAVVDPNQDIFDNSNIDATAKFKDRIRDKYMDVNIVIKNTSSNVKKMLHYVKTFFRISAR